MENSPRPERSRDAAQSKDQDREAVAAPPARRSSRRGAKLWRLVFLCLLVAAVAGAFWAGGAADPALIRAHLADAHFAPAIFVLLCIAASLVFIPRTLMAAAGGLVFGLGWGMVWATIGSTAGAVAGFLLARYVSAGLVDERAVPRLAPVLKAAERSGWRAIALIRLVPLLPHTPVNFALGVTRLSLRSYVVGSFFGMLPMTFVYTQLGASGGSLLTGGHWILPTVATAALLAASLLLPRLGFLRRGLE